MTARCWGIVWRSNNQLDGERRHIIYGGCVPMLFSNRKHAVAYIKKEYGYIATRKDLRSEPHGWRLPYPVRMRVTVEGKA